ncbi:Short-chain dehydrogenase TIC 32, chloroplastic [Orchesella cincta]|uniref:Short-chain dehydrogenase TIC 32, chloroplastic n=1 Tax=Orchesella cincta TaxID=48709 RepID=A0A1D2MV06_ORCCI|nr:Short-chain dehydrogenase TIC 32, chloroplastic [Orchesella cincta]
MTTSSYRTPGNVYHRFLKQFWYLYICGSYIALTDCLKDLFRKAPVIDVQKYGRRTDEVVVMTGGSNGIGVGIVKKLLELDYTIILGVQSMAKGEKQIADIRKLGITSGRVKLLSLDLKSLYSVRQFTKEVLSCREGKRIDMLVNNAGFVNSFYEKTQDNYESIFQVNYLSHFLLTNLLVPRMKETATKKNEPCQITFTSSCAQRGAHIDFDELETTKVYSSAKRYGDSKLCLTVHAKTLQKKFRQEGINIHTYACHPGAIATNLWHNLGVIAGLLHPIANLVFRSTDDAACVVLYPSLTPGVGNKLGGEYFESGKAVPPNKQVDLPEVQKRLWERSLELTQEAN